MKKPINKFAVVALIVILFLLSGCMEQKQNQQSGQQKPQAEEQKKDSTKLKKMQDDVEAMIAMFSGIPMIELKKQEEEGQGQQSSGQSGQSDQQSQQSSGGTSGSQQGQGTTGQQQGTQQSKTEGKSILQKEMPVSWEQALKDVEKIHIEWNDYIAQAAKDGVSKNNIDSFDNTLNKFTNLIIMKNKEEALISANSLTYSLINFWAYYKSDVPPDVLKLKYFVRNVIFYSAVNKWDKVIENFNAGKSLFQAIRATSEKEQQEKVNKIDFSIQELEKVIKIKDYPLIRLKGKLLIDNLKEMEKKEGE